MTTSNEIKALINGCAGRIGANQFAAALLQNKLQNIVLVNDIVEIEDVAFIWLYEIPARHQHLIKSISVEKGVNGGFIIVNGHRIRYTQCANPADIPCGEVGVNLVLEATGRHKDFAACEVFVNQGLKVVISAPSKDEQVQRIVIGINDASYDPSYKVSSNTSCSTNCTAQGVSVFADVFSPKAMLMVAPHAATASQRTLACGKIGGGVDVGALEDASPASTGAAAMLGTIFDGMQLDGQAVRIPMRDGSIAFMNFFVEEIDVSVDAVHNAFQAAAEGRLSQTLDYGDPRFTVRHILGSPASATYFPSATKVVSWDGGSLVTIGLGYDNEFGYSNRMWDHAALVAESF